MLVTCHEMLCVGRLGCVFTPAAAALEEETVLFRPLFSQCIEM